MSEPETNPKAQETLEPGYRRAPMKRESHGEGSITRAIEQTTGKIPSSTFLTAALGCMAASATLAALGKEPMSRFVGMWAPTLLIMGVYNKLVKTYGPV